MMLQTSVRDLRVLARPFVARPMGLVGILLILVVALAAVLSAVEGLGTVKPDYGAMLQAPSLNHPLGTDELGRDVGLRTMQGARISLIVGLGSVLVGQVVGSLLGYVSGYFGRWTDLLVQRVIDILQSMPAIVLALALVAATGPSLGNIILAIGVVQVPRAARIMRAAVLEVREQAYVEAARAAGARTYRILAQHVIPNTLAPLIILATVSIGQAIIVEGALSFLGMGSRPPNPSWGAMLVAAQTHIRQAPWLSIAPGVALTLTVMAFNFAGDLLRDVLDPRMRGT